MVAARYRSAELIRNGERKEALAAHNADGELARNPPAAWRAGRSAQCAWGDRTSAEAINLPDELQVALLLKAGADPNLGNEDGETPPMLATRKGNLPISSSSWWLRAASVNARYRSSAARPR